MAKNDTLRLSSQDFSKAKAALAGLGREAGQYVARIGRAVERGEGSRAVIHRFATEIARKLARPTNHATVQTVVDLYVAAKAAAAPAPATS